MLPKGPESKRKEESFLCRGRVERMPGEGSGLFDEQKKKKRGEMKRTPFPVREEEKRRGGISGGKLIWNKTDQEEKRGFFLLL